MTKPLSSIALCSAIALGVEAGAPEWIHLIPAGEVRTHDGRGPYRVADVAAMMAASLKSGDRLVIDENHATDLAAPEGREAPARGWIVELQQRADGVWGRVEWTKTGRELVENKEYRGVSPVIGHKKDGTITHVLRASLVNQPNFQGLTALHQQEGTTHMDFKAKLIEALGLGSDADDAAIMAAIKAKLEGGSEAAETALQSALLPIARVVGLDDKADAAAILAGVQQLKTEGGETTALQQQVVGLTGQVKSLQDDAKKSAAAAFVDAEIAKGRVGLKPERDEYVAMHMENPERAVKLVNAMPILSTGAQLGDLPTGKASADEDPVQIAAHAATYQKKQAEAGVTIDFAAAVSAVMEGRHK